MVAVSAVVWMIWHMRNHLRFQSPFHLNTAICSITNLVRLASNFSAKMMHNTVYDFKVLKFVGINTQPEKTSSFMQVINWIKVKIDRAGSVQD